jgi:acyl carrier protein
MPGMHERVRAVFREIFDDEKMEIIDKMNAHDVPGWDSLAQVKLVIALEDEFQIKFTTQEVAEMQCIGDLKTSLRKRNILE